MGSQSLYKLAQPSEKYSEELCAFASVNLQELEEVGLLKRCETKFVFKEDQLASFLLSISEDYDMLEINHGRLFDYTNIYFDTPELDYFKAHIKGRANRKKVRIRNYRDSDISFLEVKRRQIKGGDKLRKDLTRPSRPFDLDDKEISSDGLDFLRLSEVSERELNPVLKVSYKRITLVSKDRQERATVDIGLRCKNHKGDIAYFPGLVILELKQPRFDRRSAMVVNLRDRRIKPKSISKYCLGTITLSPETNHNRYKPRILALNKIMNQ